MTGRIPSRGSDQFNLRLPDGMRDRLRVAAEANGRSMNAEIVDRLQFSFDVENLNRQNEKEAEDFFLKSSYELMRREMESTQRRFAQLVESLGQVEENMRKRGMRFDD